MNLTEKTIAFADAYSAASGPIPYQRQYPTAHLTSFRIGGEADLVIYPRSERELTDVLTFLHGSGGKYMVLGCGSNVVFRDAGYRGVIVSTAKMQAIRVDGETVTADCGAKLTACAVQARRAALTGLEFAYGIPGSVGGGVFMNAGAYGGEMADLVLESTYFDPEDGALHTLHGAEHAFGYRDSIYRRQPGWVIVSARFGLHHGDAEQIRAQMEDFMARRSEKQPLEYPSAGSVFKRCPDHYTAQMIDEAGLKGFQIGGAQVSEKHAGFIVNRGGATCADVRAVVAHIKETLRARFGVDIVCEIIFVD